MKKVLVIEDNEDLRESVRTWLESAEYQVECACDGLAASALLQRFDPDLVITDLYMPGKDGIEVMAEVQANYPATRIIAVSGGAESFMRLDYLALTPAFGARQILRKPFRFDELLLAVHDALEH